MRRQYIYAIIIISACLILLESGARIIEKVIDIEAGNISPQAGWQARFFGSLMDWHEADPNLLWRFRPNLKNALIRTNSDRLLGPEIKPHKPADGYRILLLGDSSPVGMGLISRKQAFGEIARFILDKRAGGRKQVELINAAVSGYTSEQIVRFLELQNWQYEPDIVILYCGNNDASISGYYSDEALLGSQKFKTLRRIFSKFAAYRILRGLFIQPKTENLKDISNLTLRVSPERYGRNLNNIAAQCRAHGCPLIILRPPVPYLWPAGLQFKPFLHLAQYDGELILPDPMVQILGRDIAYCLDSLRFAEIYGKGDIFTRTVFKEAFNDSLPAERSIAYYQEKIAGEPRNPLWYNNLGVAYWRMGKYLKADTALLRARDLLAGRPDNSPAAMAAESPILYNIGINLLSQRAGEDNNSGKNSLDLAHIYLDSALQADYFSLRIKRDYEKQIDQFLDCENIAVVDLPSLFQERGHELLFIDHCHPTAEGHKIIADEIVRTVLDNGWF